MSQSNCHTVFSIIKKEKHKQMYGLELLASENFTSRAVLEALGSCLTNKYSKGFPGQSYYYNGLEYNDELETLCQRRALEAFGLDSEKWGVNVRPYSETGYIDYDKLQENARLFHPKLIIAGIRSVDTKGKQTLYNLEFLINQAVFPGLQGGPHNNAIAGGSDNHLILLDLRNKGTDGGRAEKVLQACAISCNKNTCLGIELTLEVQGSLDPKATLMEFIQALAQGVTFQQRVAEIRAEVEAFTGQFPMPGLPEL
ncbi:hypothetical protein GOODEAATRI_013144 [Goodea atripinnis]|uniref:Serine hydroxymethyltransferase-like domain-containing protein n=1 Tax=Goodea atripinnis TaxID=208336 RepID=A0ABV0PDR7_9TELE